MSLEVRVTARAEKDVDTIFEWLAQRSKDGAVRWYHAYLTSLHSLPIQAEGCGIAPEAEKLSIELRQILFKTRSGRIYRSLFVIVGNTIHVVGVRGSGQDLAGSGDLELPAQ
jgi:plasmid stabilization system protein ParE